MVAAHPLWIHFFYFFRPLFVVWIRNNTSFVNSRRHMVLHVTYVANIYGYPFVVNIPAQSGMYLPRLLTV